MRVLLTGPAGFIGSHLTRLLLAEGHDVHAVISPSTDRWLGDSARGVVASLGRLRGDVVPPLNALDRGLDALLSGGGPHENIALLADPAEPT